MSQLRSTVLADIQSYLGPLVKFKVTDATISFRVPLADGTRLESDWLLIPLDTTEDVRRLLSLQLTGGWIEEFRETNYGIVAALLGRCGRYPSMARVRPSWYGLIGTSNPYNTGSEWEVALEVETRANWALFRQPGGRTSQVENLVNLPPNYYQDLAAENSPEWVRIHVDALNGDSLAGQAVFRASFVPDTHVIRDGLQPTPGRSLMVGLDLGRTPSAALMQQDAWGRTLVLDEVLSEDMGLESFLQRKLRPHLSLDRYAGCRVMVSFDPSGIAKSQLSELNAWDVLKANGWTARPAPTNDIPPRLKAVERELLGTRSVPGVDGAAARLTPALLFDGTRCPILVGAMRGGYRYHRRKDGQLDEVPEKTHPDSDIVDAMGYGIMGFNSGMIGKVVAQDRRNSEQPRRISTAAWT